MVPLISNLSTNFRVTGFIVTSSGLSVGFSIVNVVLVFSSTFSLPPNQLVLGNVLSEVSSLSIPTSSESNEDKGTSITLFMFENVALLWTINFPACPYTDLTASCAFTSPAPCVNASLFKLLALDMRMLLILNGS